MFGYIFMTINKVNNKRYIGQSTFKRNHVSYFGSGKILKFAIKKYGIGNFDKLILHICKDKIELDYMEKFYIDMYNASHSTYFYNIATGGQGGNLGPLVNFRISEKVSGIRNGMYRKTHTDEVKNRIRKSRLGKTTTFTPEQKCKISNSLKHYFNNNLDAKNLVAEKQRNWYKSVDKNVLDEINNKRKASLSEYWYDNDIAKQNVSKRMSGKNNPMYGKSPAIKGKRWFCHPINKSIMLDVGDPRISKEGWKLGRIWKC